MTTTKQIRVDRKVDKAKTFLERAAQYLDAHERVKSHDAYELLSAKETQYVLLTHIARQDSEIYSVNVHDVRSPANMNLLAITIGAYYFHERGYAHISQPTLAKKTGLNIKSVRLNMDLLMLSGLWGKVEGTGMTETRYYPLFSEKGMAEFKKVIELAENGLDPLTGRLPKVKADKSSKTEEQEDESAQPQPETTDESEQESDAPEYDPNADYDVDMFSGEEPADESDIPPEHPDDSDNYY